MALLAGHALGVALGERFVLGPVDLHLQAGRHTALLGPSGSGKSTLLRLLAGYLPPTTGYVSVLGKAQNLADQLLPGFDKIAYVAQDFDLPPYQRVRDIFAQRLAAYAPEKQTEFIGAISKLFYIKDYLNEKKEQLSLGQQQRCALALAFCGTPVLIALDEPFSHQDAWLRQLLLAAVQQAAQQAGTSLLLCTHALEEALFLCQDAVYISDGQVSYAGPMGKLKSMPIAEIQALYGWTCAYNGVLAQWRRVGQQRPGTVLFHVLEAMPHPQGWLLGGAFPDGTPGWVVSRHKPQTGTWVYAYPSANK